ncbi:hypothetical protein BH23THE1_BH23THE1_13730 [soil metagenome]
MKMKSPVYAIKSVLSTFISYLILIVLAIIFMVLSTIPGQSVSIPVNSFVLSLLPSAVYGLIFAFLFDSKNKKMDLVETRASSYNDGVINKSNENANIDYNKRDMIRALIISVITIPLVYFGFTRLISGSAQQQQQQPRALDASIKEFLQSKSKPAGFENPILTPLIDAEVTPTYLFYRIDINTVVPIINAKDWSLTVKGLVDNPIVINYAEFRNMNSVEEFATLTCISNKIGGNLVSTALWKEVRLRDILSKLEFSLVLNILYLDVQMDTM